MDTQTDRKIIRLPHTHQLEALARLSHGMTAADLKNHRTQTCRTLKTDIDRLEAELVIMLSGALAVGNVLPDQIANAQTALTGLRSAVDNMLHGALNSPHSN